MAAERNPEIEVKESQILTARQAAARLGVSPATMYRWMDQGVIHAYNRPGSDRKLVISPDVTALKRRLKGKKRKTGTVKLRPV